MRRAFSLSGAFGLLAFASLVFPSEARAQSAVALTVTPNVFYRYASDQTTKITRNYPTPNERAITQKDCTDDTYVELSMTATGSCASCNIQVWVGPDGVDCSDINQRSGANAKCWIGLKDGIPYNAQGFSQKFRVQDLLSQYTSSLANVSSSYVPGTIDSCRSSRFQSTISKLNVYFLIVNGASLTAQTNTQFPLKMVGPVAPTLTDVKVGDGVLTVSFSVDSQADLRGYKAYCSPKPGSENPAEVVPPPGSAFCSAEPFGPISSDDSSSTTTSLRFTPVHLMQAVDPDGGDADAGDGGDADAGDDDGGDGGDAGGGGRITNGTRGPSPSFIDPKYECASIENAIASSIKIKNAQIGYGYNIAVAAFDTFETVGNASEWQCAIPVDVTDFWDNYTKDGGPGGGFCALEGVGLPTGAGGLLLVGAAGVASALRRRRRS